MAGYIRNDTTDQISNGNTINAVPLDGEFDAVQSAFALVGGHTHGGAIGEGPPITVVGPAQALVISANSVTPKTDNTLDLGTALLRFKSLWAFGTTTLANLIATTASIAGGTVNATVIGGTTPAAITGTTVTATSFVGPLTGAVTGNVTGNATTVTTNANLTGHVTSVGNAAVLGSFTSLQLLTALTDETGTGAAVFATSPTLVTPLLGTPTSGVMTNVTGTAAGLTAGNVTTNANLTGHVTSVGNAAVLGSFTKAQLDTAVSDGNVLYVGDAPTSHTHLLAAGATDVTATAAQLNFVAGVTSAIQTQLDAKAGAASIAYTEVPSSPFTVTAAATYTVTGLSGYRDVMIIGDRISSVLSAKKLVRVGNSGGILSTGIYINVDGVADTSGALTNNASAARGFMYEILNFNTTSAVKPVRALSKEAAAGSGTLFIDSATVFDRVQILLDTVTTMSGTVRIFGRT